MPLNIVTQGSPDESQWKVDLAPGITLLNLAIPDAQVILGGESVDLSDLNWTAVDQVDPVDVTGYLAKAHSDGEIVLLVDEVGPGEQGYFATGTPVYDPLHVLFHVQVPANTTDLEATDLRFFNVKEGAA